jgi:hypothetical protein
MPLADRKTRLASLLRRAPAGLGLTEHTDDEGAAVFAQACRMGLEGIVSKRMSAPYPVGALAGLAQGEEPGQPGHGAGARGRVVEMPVMDNSADKNATPDRASFAPVIASLDLLFTPNKSSKQRPRIGEEPWRRDYQLHLLLRWEGVDRPVRLRPNDLYSLRLTCEQSRRQTGASPNPDALDQDEWRGRLDQALAKFAEEQRRRIAEAIAMTRPPGGRLSSLSPHA